MASHLRDGLMEMRVQHVQAPEFTTLQSHALKVSIDGDLVIGLPFSGARQNTLQ